MVGRKDTIHSPADAAPADAAPADAAPADVAPADVAPANVAGAGAAGAVRAASADGLPRSVLVVEDDTILALATEDALRAAGIEEVNICNSTAQALELLRAVLPDALVLDVHLADRDDGWAIAELVTEMGPNPPRIIFSTGAPRDIPQEIGELGTVLEKPYEPEQLLAALRDKPQGLLARLRGALR